MSASEILQVLRSTLESAENDGSAVKGDDAVLLSNVSDTIMATINAYFIVMGFKTTSSPVQQSETYQFTYSHDKSSLTFTIKAMQVSSNLVLSATSGDKQVYTQTIDPSLYTCAHFPYPLTKEKNSIQALESTFEGLDKVDSLKSLIFKEIINKIAPSLKEGAADTASQSSNQTNSSNNGGRSGIRDDEHGYPTRVDPRYMPGEPPQFPRNPYRVGGADLDPFAAAPGMIRPPGFDPSGGMVVGPNHPMFSGDIGPELGPRIGNVPPGARYDPVSPLGRQPFPGPGRMGRGGRGRGFPSGDPDFDEYIPQGGFGDNMFL